MVASADVKNKTAIVTGTTSGLGRSVARVWAAQGANVVATGRREELGRELEKDASEEGHELVFVAGDVARTADCRAAVQTAAERYGGVDILVNNAGIEGVVSHTHEVGDEDWDAVFDTNIGGAFRMARAVIPVMKERGGGTILNIASINGMEAPLAHMAAYNSSKAAVVQFSNTLAIEYLLDNIRSNAIILGGVRETELGTGSRTQEALAKIMRGPDYVRPPANQDDPLSDFVLQDPDEVAGMLSVLCSDAMRLMTGAAIALDRAMTAGFTGSMFVHLSTANMLQITS